MPTGCYTLHKCGIWTSLVSTRAQTRCTHEVHWEACEMPEGSVQKLLCRVLFQVTGLTVTGHISQTHKVAFVIKQGCIWHLNGIPSTLGSSDALVLPSLASLSLGSALFPSLHTLSQGAVIHAVPSAASEGRLVTPKSPLQLRPLLCSASPVQTPRKSLLNVSKTSQRHHVQGRTHWDPLPLSHRLPTSPPSLTRWSNRNDSVLKVPLPPPPALSQASAKDILSAT